MKEKVAWFGAHPHEGSVSMEVYRRNLLTAVSRYDPFEIKCWPEDQQFFSERLPSRVGRAFSKYISYPCKVKRHRESKIVHFLDHSSAHLIPCVGLERKIVVTLHDLIPLRFGGELSENQRRRFLKTVTHLAQADAIISVSDYSKKEAVDILGLDPDRIYVVPNGVEKPTDSEKGESEASRMRARGVDCVVLSVGSVQERKNLKILPDALLECQKRLGADHRIGLLRVGDALPVALKAKLHQVLGEGGLKEAGRIDEKSLWREYAAVDAVIVPSLYEGFGLPVIEAFRVGTPVAASCTSSLPEVGQDLAEYFSPENGVDAGDALFRSLNSGPEGRARRQRYAEQFTWRNHLEICYLVYRQITDTVI